MFGEGFEERLLPQFVIDKVQGKWIKHIGGALQLSVINLDVGNQRRSAWDMRAEVVLQHPLVCGLGQAMTDHIQTLADKLLGLKGRVRAEPWHNVVRCFFVPARPQLGVKLISMEPRRAGCDPLDAWQLTG